MANELYRTYEVLVEESIHTDHPKRVLGKNGKPLKTSKELKYEAEIDGALRDTHMIFQDAVCYNTLCFAGLAGNEVHQNGEHEEPLNPLWKHLTTPMAQGGIKAETEKVVRRLATHYKPLENVTTAEEFLNRVYSEPLRILDEMTDVEKASRRRLRAQCYRLAEKDGTKPRASGGMECKDMASFANTWTGLLSVAGGTTVIPGNGAYDCVSRELKEKLKGADENEAAKIIDRTLLAYAAEEESQCKLRCDVEYSEKLEMLKEAVAETEKLPDTEKTKRKKIEAAKAKLAKHENGRNAAAELFFKELRETLAADVASAASVRIASKAGSELKLTADEFTAVKKSAAVVELGEKKHIRLREKKGRPGSFEATMFRYWLLRDGAASLPEGESELLKHVALREFRRYVDTDKPDDEPQLDGKHIKQMPFKDRGADFGFLFFGKFCLGMLPPESTRSSPDRDFDAAAFKTAAEDVFKYKDRTIVRARKIRRLLNVVQAYENDGAPLCAEDSPTGKPLTIRGLRGDPRWKDAVDGKKGIEALVLSLGKPDGGDDEQMTRYGLREGTIGGWAEVRKMFLRRYKQCYGRAKRMVALPRWLEKGVDKEQTANRQGFGSADFFHALCKAEYHHLWMGGAGNEHNEIKDFIPHYVAYCEWREELIWLLTNKDGTDLDWTVDLSEAERKKLTDKPIRYTWPGLLNRHKKPSYRYYDFSQKLNVTLELKCLFRRVRSKDDPKVIERYNALPKGRAKLTLAARRLKRDKIVNKDNETGVWSSADALWCPPLILAGESEPTAKEKPRAGKEKAKASDEAEVSFSLIASPLPGDFWNAVADVPSTKHAEPVHLTVSFKIEGDETAKLRAETKQWLSGSHRGFAKKGEKDADKRRCFNWPIDRDTSKHDADGTNEKAKLLWCGEGKDAREWKGFAFRHDGKTTPYSEPSFDILSIDLGNRFAAAFARMRIHADANGGGRVISAGTFEPVIKADVVREGTMRLQGEAVDIWQVVTEKNQKHIARKLKARGEVREPVAGAYEFVEEAYGNGGRGRFPTAEEYGVFSRLAARLIAVEACSLSGKDKETVPELGDHLVFRLKRRIGRLRTLLNLAWRLCGDKEKDRKGHYAIGRKPEQRAVHFRMVIETLARSAFPKRERQEGETEEPDDQSLRLKLAEQSQWDEWRPLFESKKGKEENERRLALEKAALSYSPAKWVELADAVKKQIETYCAGADSLEQLLVGVIEFCLPLRGRRWGWDRFRNARLHWDKKEEEHKPNIMGMRGLSMKRLEQILNLRQRCQSFAKLEDRYHGAFKSGNYNPPDSIARDLIEDVCPLLLERSNRIREQRVDQTAHLILAEALGMELKNPADVVDKKGRKTEVDLHGEYQRRKDKHGNPHPRCSIIVLENLERYKTSQERTKMENSRLMKWAHRAIIEKLEDMCRPFGITLMLVDPAFSSHFDSRTGLPGVRVNEVPRDFEQQYPYAKWAKDTKKTGGPTKLAEDIKKLAADFAKHPKYMGTLVLAVEGGKEFVPVMSLDGGDSVINADITAAVNIGLRGVADPQRWDVFPRLRTKKLSDTEVMVTSWRGWFARFGKESGERMMKKPTDDDHAAAESGDAVVINPAAKKKKGTSAKSAAVAGTAAADDASSQSAQSSEYPPFFVQHPEHDWPPKSDWLKKDVFGFSEQDGKPLRAYPQGVYLKRVEQVCADRINEINRARIQKTERDRDDVPK